MVERSSPTVGVDDHRDAGRSEEDPSDHPGRALVAKATAAKAVSHKATAMK